jgi:glycerophosphoryl diester phosphodiesterase
LLPTGPTGMDILAHRANVAGPDHATENSPSAFRAALSRGWGLEIDVRHTAGNRLYISHDARDDARTGTESLGADECFAAIRQHPRATIAVNVKELGREAELLSELSRHGVIGQCFLFDMELIEAQRGETARVFRGLDGAVSLAARVSDRNEPIEGALADTQAGVVWLDEFDGPWCSERDIRRLKSAGKAVYAVSPDLHGRTLEQAQRRWIDFFNWNVDGICTDYPAELQTALARLERNARS